MCKSLAFNNEWRDLLAAAVGVWRRGANNNSSVIIDQFNCGIGIDCSDRIEFIVSAQSGLEFISSNTHRFSFLYFVYINVDNRFDSLRQSPSEFCFFFFAFAISDHDNSVDKTVGSPDCRSIDASSPNTVSLTTSNVIFNRTTALNTKCVRFGFFSPLCFFLFF